MGQYAWLMEVPDTISPAPIKPTKPILRIAPSARLIKPETPYDRERKAKPVIIYHPDTKYKTFVSHHRRPHAYNPIEQGVFEARDYSPALELAANPPKEGQISLGIELELINDTDAYNNFKCLKAATQTYLAKQAVLVTDGSLRGRGAEINSIPLTESKYRSTRHLWYLYIRDLVKNKYIVTDRCGLHVHISTIFMPETNWRALQAWICRPDIANYFMRISGRNPNIGDGFYYCQFIPDSRKYRALHLGYTELGAPQPTREFRLFGSTTKPSIFFNSIETCILLAKWAHDACPQNDTQLDHFFSYACARPDYPQTSAWLMSEHEKIKLDTSYFRIKPERPKHPTRIDPWRLLSNELPPFRWSSAPSITLNDPLYTKVKRAIHQACFDTPYWPYDPNIPNRTDQNFKAYPLELSFEGYWSKHLTKYDGVELSKRVIWIWSLDLPTHTGIRLYRTHPGWGQTSRVSGRLY